MTHTLVAAFDSPNEAQAAKAELLKHNIVEGNIKLSSSALKVSEHSADVTVHDDAHDPAHHESLGHKISHFFSSLFGSDEHDKEKPHRYATAYPEAYNRGATVLTVTLGTDEQAEQAEEILERNGAIDIDERSASWNNEAVGSPHAAGVTGHTTHLAGTHLDAMPAQGMDRTVAGDRLASADTHAGRTSIPVIEEDLRVGKREVTTGRVRVVSRVTERPVEETVNLHEEHAHIERRPVDRAAVPGELSSFKAGSIEIQETAEELVVEKNARVVEEVSVGKQSSDRQETVRDTVRRTDVDVQSEPGSTVHHDGLVNPNDPLKNRP